jgi:glycosyltransferase involved in cell wall biosynthesis
MNESLTVVLPMYNEEDNVEKVLKELDPILKNIFKDYEILVVESGSKDKTAEVLEKQKKVYPNLKVINQGAKLGLGSAIKEGIRSATKDYILYIDGDLPFDLNVLNRIFPLKDELQVLVGFRPGDRESFNRKFFSMGYNMLVKSLFNIKVRDVNYSFKLFRADIIKNTRLISNGWFIDAEILARLSRKKVKIKQIGIPYKFRKSGTSNISINHRLITGFLKEMWNYYKDEKRHNKRR